MPATSYYPLSSRFNDLSPLICHLLSFSVFPCQVKENPHNYDAWFDYIRLSESEGKHDATRTVYERAIANVPLDQEKRYWRRYIYLWIYYAVFEELEAQVQRLPEPCLVL